jgi:hypothetical protein
MILRREGRQRIERASNEAEQRLRVRLADFFREARPGGSLPRDNYNAAFAEYVTTLFDIVVHEVLADNIPTPRALSKWLRAAVVRRILRKVNDPAFLYPLVSTSLEQAGIKASIVNFEIQVLPTIVAEKTLDDCIDDLVDRMSDFDSFFASETPPAPQPSVTSRIAEPIRTAAEAWDQIHIKFLSEERVQIHTPDTAQVRNYAEMGFADRRTENPNRAWKLLAALSESDGRIIAAMDSESAWPKVEKRIQEIRKQMRILFGLGGDPIPYVDGTGYVAQFKISRVRSFNA